MVTTATKAPAKKAAAKPNPAAKAPKPEPVLVACGDGCGLMVKSRFAPGHDARLKSKLINTALDSSVSASARAAAEKELSANGWNAHLSKTRGVREGAAAKVAARAAAKAEVKAAKDAIKTQAKDAKAAATAAAKQEKADKAAAAKAAAAPVEAPSA